jgi:predicted small integral membrane protein
MMTTRKSKACILAVIAAYFLLIVFNNITDFDTNYWCVKSVLGMETIKSKAVLWRAIETPWIVKSVYVFIVSIEATIALLCSWSAILMLKKRNGKPLAALGLTLAFALFMFGFVTIAGEWFYMYMHPQLSNVVPKTTILALLMLVSLFFITSNESESN